jgi:small subunit ribosomal protein S8
MSMTDPIADLLTRVRNAVRNEVATVDAPYSKLKEGITGVLKREGYIQDFKVMDLSGAKKGLRVYLRYGSDGEAVIGHVQRVSKPGRRIYRSVPEIVPVLDGLGIGVYSTPKGILTDRECRKEKVGGECLCEVW